MAFALYLSVSGSIVSAPEQQHKRQNPQEKEEEQEDMDDAALSAALVAAVRELFKGPNRDQLSVNNVRKQVEEEQGLDSGFFAGPEWKSRSKTLIKETVVRH